jgi:hypothetical protein
MATFTPTKRCANNSPLSVNEKLIILKVHDCIKYDYPKFTVQETVDRCSRMTGVGKSTVFKLLRGRKKAGQVEPPKKSSGRPVKVLDENTKSVIRRKVHSFYFKKEIPTLDKILTELGQDDSIPLITKKLLWTTLRNMDFA